MANNNSSNAWLWFIARRSVVHLLIGALSGALWGAICVGLAGAIIGMIVSLIDNSPFKDSVITIFGKDIDVTMATIGGALGLLFGASVGGFIGFFGYLTVGIVAPPSRSLLPSRVIGVSMLKAMALATLFGTLCYFIWSAIFGLFGLGFEEALQAGLFFALYGVPALMGLGQIYGIYSGTKKLGKREASPVTSEL